MLVVIVSSKLEGGPSPGLAGQEHGTHPVSPESPALLACCFPVANRVLPWCPSPAQFLLSETKAVTTREAHSTGGAPQNQEGCLKLGTSSQPAPPSPAQMGPKGSSSQALPRHELRAAGAPAHSPVPPALSAASAEGSPPLLHSSTCPHPRPQPGGRGGSSTSIKLLGAVLARKGAPWSRPKGF